MEILRMIEYTVLKDTREKQGWDFNKDINRKNSKCRCLGTETATLKTGDYTIKGYEDQILVERKSGFEELFNNMVPKTNKDRFEREMQRMLEVEHRYIIIESSLNHDLWMSSPPQMKFGLSVSRIFEWMIEVNQQYKITPILAGECGQKVCKKIFEAFLKGQTHEKVINEQGRFIIN